MKYLTKPPIGTPLNLIHPLNYGLVGYWPFLEGSGYIVKDLINNNTASNANTGGAALWGGSRFGRSARFDGAFDRYVAKNIPQLNVTNNFTISLWFAPAVLTQTNRYLLSKLNTAQNDNNYSVIWEYVNNTVEFYAGGFSGTSPRTGSGMVISDTNMHHIVYTYNGSTWSGYLDSVPIFSVSRTFSLNTGTGQFVIGAFTNASGTVPNGIIDEVRVYNRCLSMFEVKQLYSDPFCMYKTENSFRWFNTFERKGSFFFSRL
jgi:hypothetical protein